MADKVKVLNLPPPLVKDKRNVMLVQDHHVFYPELWLDVYIHGTRSEQMMFAEMFARAKCKKASSPDDADFVVFTGGEDVSPHLYMESVHHTTRYKTSRDLEDITMYKHCLKKGIPMLGICRGAQFLHVMNGGKLFQDVDNHYGDHKTFDMINKKMGPTVSSVHHQMCRDNPSGGMKILLTSSRSRERWINDVIVDNGQCREIEAFWYDETLCLGIQGHPEYSGYEDFTEWSLKAIDKFFVENEDIRYQNRHLRLHPDTLAQRKEGWGHKPDSEQVLKSLQ